MVFDAATSRSLHVQCYVDFNSCAYEEKKEQIKIIVIYCNFELAYSVLLYVFPICDAVVAVNYVMHLPWFSCRWCSVL